MSALLSCTCVRILVETSVASALQLGQASLYRDPHVGFWAHEVCRPVLSLGNEEESEGHIPCKNNSLLIIIQNNLSLVFQQ